MTDADRVPLTGAAMDLWPAVAGVDPAVRVVAAGIGAVLPDGPGFIDWQPPTTVPGVPGADLVARLAQGWDPDAPARIMPPPLRLTVSGAVLPTEVLPRLMACPAIGSVVLPVLRAPGALMRRPWTWPLRIGVADDELIAQLQALRGSGPVPEQLVAVTDVRVSPGAVDLLVLRATPAKAAEVVTARRQVANAVVCIADAACAWPIIDAQLAMVRAASAAVVTALVPVISTREIAEQVLLTVRYLSHAHAFDVALTAAFQRRILITAETDALAELTLPVLIRRRVEDARIDIRILSRSLQLPMAEPPELPEMPTMAEMPEMPPMAEMPEMAGAEPLPMAGAGPTAEPPVAPPEDERARAIDLAEVESAADELAEMADGAFDHESAEASRALDAQARIDAGIEAAGAAAPRFLQAYVGSKDAGNVLQPGSNTVSVFVGPTERAALRAEAVPQHLLFDDPAATSARITVVLAPLVPLGAAVRAELDVPRVGRSVDVPLEWLLPEAGVVQARLLLIHRNRVLQTARITGRVGAAAEVTERIVLWDQVGRLDDRRPFDGTIVLNHDANGESKVVAHADGETTISPMAEIDAVARRIRRRLLEATQLTSKADDPARTKILIAVAAGGSELYRLLRGYLKRFLEAQRIQIVTARSGFFLPLELVYHRPPPDLDAALCPNWAADAECGEHCFADADDTSIVCPSVFWGMSRYFERQVVELSDENGTGFTVKTVPVRGAERRRFDTALVAASKKVTDAAVKGVLAALGVERVKTWDEWVAAIDQSPRDLLLLMPHTDDADATMEISGTPMERVRIVESYVTGDDDQSHPAVVLFGCDTAGSEEDPAGFANWFMDLGASFVFSTLTMLLARHAASMSESLVQQLRDPARSEQSLGEFVAAYRREAVRGGQISALAVTAYGDADWSL